MQIRRGMFGLGAALLGAIVLVAAVRAATVSSGGITLTYPGFPVTGPAFQTCEPASEPAVNTVTVSGIPDGSSVSVTFVWSQPFSGDILASATASFTAVAGGELVVPVQYPASISQWPVWDPTTNEHALAVSVMVRVQDPAGAVTKLIGKKWWMRCVPPKTPFQGCTPGYWKQDQHFDSWTPTGLAPADDFEALFGVNATFDPHTLLDGLEANGGGEFALARHAVAAMLNALSPSVNYQFTAAQIIAGVQHAYATGDFEPFKTQLDFANNAGCPLN